ncbi:hypothetical protein GE09DRAFT_1081479 [Coniochaeta sp. 2T2.1]|nr:hypothetical protein GE09DRAFT_1081479 [Coniochaeta sp. 2T2.1]
MLCKRSTSLLGWAVLTVFVRLGNSARSKATSSHSSAGYGSSGPSRPRGVQSVCDGANCLFGAWPGDAVTATTTNITNITWFDITSLKGRPLPHRYQALDVERMLVSLVAYSCRCRSVEYSRLRSLGAQIYATSSSVSLPNKDHVRFWFSV